ncbi:hypothetical protein DFQ30_007666 [Apophysomyces sp. BC1015]|nr:hypothetical protein DFQ30_007666 [Apophysomyces sp. BC1015]
MVFDPPPTFQRHHQYDSDRSISSPSSSSASSAAGDFRPSLQRQRKRQRRYEFSPTEIFAQNLSDAVLDAAAISVNEGFIYRTDRKYLPPPYALRPAGRFKRTQDSWYPNEEEDETSPLLYSKRNQKLGFGICMQPRNLSWWWRLFGWALLLFLVFSLDSYRVVLLMAEPLDTVQALSINNVLGTEKQLIFDLHVQAR